VTGVWQSNGGILANATAGSVVVGTASPAPSTTAPAQHILTMARMLGYQGATCCTLAQAQPYVTWLFNLPQSDTANATSLGMKSLFYQDATVGFSTPGDTDWWKTLQNNAQDIARDCAGNIIGSPPSEEYGDITQAGWRSLWNGVAANVGSGYTALFADGAGDVGSGALPCGTTDSTYVADMATMFSGTPFQVIANNVFESAAMGTNWHTVDSGANVIGAMADSDCYVDANAYGMGNVDFAITQGMHSYGYAVDDWSQREDDELYLGQQQKLFVCLIGASHLASSETALRTYAYASLMLTYSVRSTTYFTYWKTNGSTQVEVYPETGIVPANPVVATPSDVSALKVGGVYVREYQDCFYRGVDEGGCAFVVNPTTGTQTIPVLSRSYGHSVTLSGGGVLEGGNAGFSGPAPKSLSSGSAVIEAQ
jgi:hypothetical protein